MDADTPRDILRDHFVLLEDPRMNRTRRHSLHDILTITFLAVLCGADSFVQIEQFGKSRHAWLKTFLDLPHGIPSHDTFGRVLAALDPMQFEQCLLRWTAALATSTKGRLIPLDGKTLRGSFDKASGQEAIHMVNAWCVQNHLVLGQLATDAKSNEITALPALLELLDLKDAIVTADALHCQTATAAKIIDGGGDYVLQVKGNQGTLHDQLRIDLNEAILLNFEGMDHAYHETIEKGHGRIEKRCCWCTSDISWVPGLEKWKGLASVAIVERHRSIKDKEGEYQTSIERSLYISSLPGDDAKQILEAVRGHWGIENSLHWCLDVSFGEDASRVRVGHAPENLSRVRRMVLNQLKQEKSLKVGIQSKRMRCAWDDDYLFKVLTQGQN